MLDFRGAISLTEAMCTPAELQPPPPTDLERFPRQEIRLPNRVYGKYKREYRNALLRKAIKLEEQEKRYTEEHSGTIGFLELSKASAMSFAA